MHAEHKEKSISAILNCVSVCVCTKLMDLYFSITMRQQANAYRFHLNGIATLSRLIFFIIAKYCSKWNLLDRTNWKLPGKNRGKK